MQKRFSLQDFTLYAILAVIITILLLSMYMIDRQWLKMAEIEHQVNDQAADLRDIRNSIRDLGRQPFVEPGTKQTLTPEDIPPSFRRAYQASLLPDYNKGDWLIQAFGSGIKTLTPYISTDKYASDIQSMVLETLLTYDPDTLELIGHIAKSWTISNDGLILTYKMRDNVIFSDGVKLTAHDVQFTYEFAMTEAIAAPRERSYYKKIKSVKALNDYTVEFVFIEPYYNSLLMSGAMEILPRHFYQKYLKEPEKFNESKGILLGSGPYRLKNPASWSPDQGGVELIRNERYWGPVNPTYNRVLWKVIEHDSARLTTFRNREIDAYSARPIEYKQLLNDKALTARTHNFEYMPPINGYFYVGWNQQKNGKKTIFADKRVRQAMTYLTDRKKIIDEIFLGYGEVAMSPFNPQSAQHNKKLVAYEYNVEKAKTLLKQAGFEDRDGDGVLENAQGQRFEFELTFSNNSEDYKRLVLLLKDLYAKAGVALIPKATEWPVMLEQSKKRDFDAMVLGWTSVVESDLYQIFHSSQIKDNADNFVSYANESLDNLISQARVTVDKSKRMPLWHQCEEILHEDQPYTFLYRRAALVFIDRRFKNLKVTNFGLNLDRTPIESYVPTAQQKYLK